MSLADTAAAAVDKISKQLWQRSALQVDFEEPRTKPAANAWSNLTRAVAKNLRAAAAAVLLPFDECLLALLRDALPVYRAVADVQVLRAISSIDGERAAAPLAHGIPLVYDELIIR